MKDEIKEELDDLLSRNQNKLLLDYITNLQKEKRKLKAELELYKDNNNYLNDKIDKAIEHIKRNTKDNTFCEYYDGEVKDLLNILKGE